MLRNQWKAVFEILCNIMLCRSFTCEHTNDITLLCNKQMLQIHDILPMIILSTNEVIHRHCKILKCKISVLLYSSDMNMILQSCYIALVQITI